MLVSDLVLVLVLDLVLVLVSDLVSVCWINGLAIILCSFWVVVFASLFIQPGKVQLPSSFVAFCYNFPNSLYNHTTPSSCSAVLSKFVASGHRLLGGGGGSGLCIGF